MPPSLTRCCEGATQVPHAQQCRCSGVLAGGGRQGGRVPNTRPHSRACCATLRRLLGCTASAATNGRSPRIQGDDASKFDAAVLAAPVITPEDLLGADCIIIGAPGRQGGFAGEVRLFLDSMASFQRPSGEGNTSKLMVRAAAVTQACVACVAPPLPRSPSCGTQASLCMQGKVGAAFTSIGGQGRGFGGHEVILQQFHATFLQHGMVCFRSTPL